MNPEHLLTLTGVFSVPEANGPPDAFGDPTLTVTEHSFRCWLYQEERREQTASEDTQIEEWRLVVERAAAGVIDGSSSIAVDGVVYEFAGPPWAAFNPRTQVITHVEATVRRTV